MGSTPVKPIDLMNVSLLTSIDPYKLSDRATKYGILFVVLIVWRFFSFEIMKELPIHSVQFRWWGSGWLTSAGCRSFSRSMCHLRRLT